MHTCDALIIGGGPAGSTCAAHLRAAGMDVLVLDKAVFPRDKTCAGWITPAVVGALGLDLHDYANTRVLQPITGFCTGLIGGRAVSTGYDRPVSYGIRRCEFDDYLLRRSGARLLLGEKADTIERSGRSWVVNGSIRTPLLIGAGGHFCPVARLLGRAAASAPERVVAAQEIEFRMEDRQIAGCAARAACPELYFCPDLKGYGWCFRKGNYLNIGLGREDPRRLGDHVAAFHGLMRRLGRIPPDTPEKYRGHAYLLYGHAPRRLAGDGFLLIGDSAGLAYPESGEGIRTAVESGLLAAETILESPGDGSERALEAYSNRIRRRFGRVGASASDAEAAPGLRARAAAFLLSTRWFSRHVLINRWFLRTHQPDLASRLAFRAA